MLADHALNLPIALLSEGMPQGAPDARTYPVVAFVVHRILFRWTEMLLPQCLARQTSIIGMAALQKLLDFNLVLFSSAGRSPILGLQQARTHHAATHQGHPRFPHYCACR